MKTWVALAVGGVLGAAVGGYSAIYLYRRSLASTPSGSKPQSHGVSSGLNSVTPLPSGPSGGGGGSLLRGAALLEDEVVGEQLTRNIQFFGKEAQAVISSSLVVVVGLGGVGSHAATCLLRSGVARLRLIDFDQVTVSSLNRHAVAERSDVGSAKAVCLQRHFTRLFPEAEVDARVAMFSQESVDELLGGSPDFVIDAIDNIDTKVDLLHACAERNIPVLCCGGAGGKADPTRVRICDLAESAADPLCRAVRARLKKKYGLTEGLPVLLSTEKQRCDLVWSGEGDDMSQYQVVPNFRVRTIPVLGALPAIFGLAAAAFVLTQLANQPINPDPPQTVQMDQCITLYDRLTQRCEENWGLETMRVDQEDVVYLVKELWRGRSARSGGPHPGKGMWRSTHNLHLTLWDRSRPAYVDNLVLLTRDEADAHDQAELSAIRSSEPEFYNLVERNIRRSRRENGFDGDKNW